MKRWYLILLSGSFTIASAAALAIAIIVAAKSNWTIVLSFNHVYEGFFELLIIPVTTIISCVFFIKLVSDQWFKERKK
jgi:hypothetical protein